MNSVISMNELEIIRHNRIPGLTVFFNTVDYRTPHFHPEWELMLLLDNPIQVGCGGENLKAEKGELLLFLPNQPHELHTFGQSSTFLCLQLKPELLHLDQLVVTDDLRLNAHLTQEKTVRIREDLLEIIERYLRNDPFDSLYCLGKACLLFQTIFTSVPVREISREELTIIERRNKRLSSLIRFVDENYMHKLRLSDFAEQEGFSMSYLSHFIKSTLNQSFQEYVSSVRVNAACKLMAAGEKKLTEISLESGFSDYRYFSNAFKKQFGLTPEQYGRSLVKPENAVIHHSIHSLERFYTDDQSRQLLDTVRADFTNSASVK